MKNQSLVQKAKAIKSKHGRKPHKYTEEEIELILAWVNDDISLLQLGKVMNIPNGAGMYTYVALGLRQFIKETN